MRPDYKPNLHNRPPHITDKDGVYFVTSRTIEGQWFLQPDKYKKILLDTIRLKTKKFSFPLLAYAILNNHYHMMVNIKDASLFSKFMNEINGTSSREINKADHVIDRKIWWNYFETLVQTEKQFYTHLNYIHQNPIKHGLCKSFEYDFSSYNAWLKKRGKEYLDDSFTRYPVIDFMVTNDEF